MSIRDTTPLAAFSVSRYDIVLSVIPLAFASSLLVGTVLSVAPSTALAIGSLLGVLAVIDALFLNPPGGGTGRPGS